MLDYIASILVRGLNLIFRVVPISASLWLGRRIGSAVFLFNRKRRMIAYANLKAAFGAEKTPAELRGITKRVYQSLVQTFIEVLNLTKVDRRYIERYVEIVNRERVENASRSGRGTILLTAHFGDWELSSLTSAVIGYPILVLAREQKMERLNELLNRLRESKGCKVIRKGFSMKNILRALHANEIVGILSDQDAGKAGVFVDFFGRPTSTHAGPAQIALKTGSLILPNFIVRTHGAHHKVFLEEYIDVRAIGGEDAVREALQRFAALLESYVRKYPDQWLWLHKRWKSTPTRTVLLLNDGKAGHLNQSRAVAEAIRAARETQGYLPGDTKITVVDVKYKSPLHRAALTFSARFASWRCQGRMTAMRACLDEASYRALMGSYSEFVVSCGSSLAPVNVYMGYENNAKNIVIMKPSGIGPEKFTLVIAPKHDRMRPRKNVVETVLAPNLMDTDACAVKGDALRAAARLVSAKAVALLLGGDTPEFELTKETALAAVDAGLSLCARHGAKLLVTTSRRTSRAVEAAVKEKLVNEPRCAFLVIANEKNPEYALGGMLALSDLIVVTAESVSMVSEAVSAGKRVVALGLQRRGAGKTKHERMMEELAAAGYVRTARTDTLAAVLETAWNDASVPKRTDDRERVFAAVRRLI